MIQGGAALNNPNEYLIDVVHRLNNQKSLSLKEKSKSLFKNFLPKIGLIMCNDCNNSNTYIELIFEEENPHFKFNSCSCKPTINEYPLNVLCNKILPDFCVIFSDTLLRLFKLGFFKGYTIIIPNFIFDVCDKNLIGKARRNKLDEFVTKCSELHNSGFFNLKTFKENKIIKFEEIKPSNFNEIEDSIMLELSKLTSSFLITTDKILHNRLLIEKLPHFYIPGIIESKLKHLT